MRRIAVVTALVLLVVTGTALAATLHPLIAGWEYYFKLDWQTDTRGGTPLVYGKILNDWGYTATSVRLLVDGLDGSGNIVTQKVEWVSGQITPGTRAYFEIKMPQAASYRVSVFAYTWVQVGGGNDLR